MPTTKFEIGKYSTLKVSKIVDFGVYLSPADSDDEILLPSRYVPEDIEVGAELEVFIYHDSDGRPIATTLRPKAVVGEFALLKVRNITTVGAFMDLGLMKDLLVPFIEQKTRMEQGRNYLVYVYIDDATGRMVGSSKLDKFLDNKLPQYSNNEMVDVIAAQRTDLGYKVIINNLHWGMAYSNEIFAPLNIGEHYPAFIKQVRTDGKIDVKIGRHTADRLADLANLILSNMKFSGGRLAYDDKSSPDEIRAMFSCSKKDFKKAIGMLLKQHKITKDGNSFISC